MKLNAHTAFLIAGLALAGSGCAALSPSAETPEWEQADADYRAQTDTATLKAQDSFWEFVSALAASVLAP